MEQSFRTANRKKAHGFPVKNTGKFTFGSFNNLIKLVMKLSIVGKNIKKSESFGIF